MWPTVDELAAFMRTTVEDSAAAEQALQLARSIVQTEVGSPIEETSETVTLYSAPIKILVLPHFPVSEITSVTEDGELLVEDEDYAWSSSGLLLRLNHARWDDPIIIEYTHGYREIPGFVRTVVMSIAARAYQSSDIGAVRQETIGSYSVTYASDNSDSLVLEWDRRMLDPLRSPSVA